MSKKNKQQHRPHLTGSHGFLFPAKPKCHKGPHAVFQAGKATVWAGARDEFFGYWSQFALLVSCAGPGMAPPAPNAVVTVSGHVAGLRMLPPDMLEIPKAVPWIAINWPDGGIPRMTRAAWDQLAASLPDIEGNVGLYCMGGHGRTGTALSILACLCGAVPADADPVEWVRQQYCSEVVETEEQTRYVAEMTGRRVDALGSWLSQYPEPPLYGATTQYAAGKAGKPVTNAAGDVTHYEYDPAFDPDSAG